MPSAYPFTPDLADPRSQRWGDAATGIVCDPQGLTCYTRGQISQQWRWTELARIVALDSQAALGIITRAGDKQRYSNHRLSAADYADIARCAQPQRCRPLPVWPVFSGRAFDAVAAVRMAALAAYPVDGNARPLA